MLLVKKGKTPDLNSWHGAAVNHDGFHLYRNCVYNVETTDKQQYHGRLVDMQPDTLYFTNFLNESVADKIDMPFDTVAIHFRQLGKFHMVADRAMGLYTTLSLDNFDFYFWKDTTNCTLPSEWAQIFENDPYYYELVPTLTAQGIDLIYEEAGQTYFFYGTGLVKPDRAKIDLTYDVRNGVWFTPCRVEKINGVAIGINTENIKNDRYNEKDSLVVNGLNLLINPFEIFMLLYPQMYTHLIGPYPDSLEFYTQYLEKDIETHINGVNISLVLTSQEATIKGLNITGAITTVDEIDGVSISGLMNFAYLANGVSLATFYNRATVAKGVQIGLVNKATSLRGVQLGLWNTNGKRSLAFINWQFRD